MQPLIRGQLIDRSGTITLGGAPQQLATANATRCYLFVQNTSAGVLGINFGQTPAAVASPSIQLAAGATFTMSGPFVSDEAITIVGATTGQTFTAKEF